MRLYNNIAKSDLNRKINRAFKDLYSRLIYGNNKLMDAADVEMINSVLEAEGTKKDLKLMSLYNVSMINTVYDADALELLVNYKNKFL